MANQETVSLNNYLTELTSHHNLSFLEANMARNHFRSINVHGLLIDTLLCPAITIFEP
jgi:hypothetical protein